jgi:putative sigma-54 modulation protein
MFIIIRGKNVPVTDELRSMIERQLRFALDRTASEIRRVDVRLEDLNGPRGGVDKRGLILLKWNKGTMVVTSHIAEDLLRAVSGAIDRAAAAMARVLERRREHDTGMRDRGRPSRRGPRVAHG